MMTTPLLWRRLEEQIQPLCAGFSGITIYNHMVNLDSSNRYGRLVYANE